MSNPRLMIGAGVIAAVAAFALPGVAHDHDHHRHHHGHADHGDDGHDHSQHHHDQIVKFGTVWEAGVDVVDWSKPAHACEVHPFIVSNHADGNCPITAWAKFNQPTAKPAGVTHRLGLVLLPQTKPQHPVTDAQIVAKIHGDVSLKLKHEAGYYWVDLPDHAKHGSITLTVSQGKLSQSVTLAHL